MDSRWSMVLLTYYTRPFLGFLVGMLTFGIIWAVRLAADAAWHPYSDLRSFAVLTPSSAMSSSRAESSCSCTSHSSSSRPTPD